MSEDIKVIGTVTDNYTVVRVGPRYSDKANDAKASFRLMKGDTVEINGFTIDPDGDSKWKNRYRFERDGTNYWTAAKLVSVSESDFRKLPYISAWMDSSQNLLETILGAIGIKDEASSISVGDALSLAKRLWTVPLKSSVKASLTDAGKARDLIEELEGHGVKIFGENNGEWNLDEIELIASAVRKSAQATAKIVEAVTGVYNEKLAFQLMYGPINFSRNPNDNVNNTNTAGVWYARNSKGYEIVLGNKVFFEGKTRLKALAARNIPVYYSSEQLIAHELAHALNYRYMVVFNGVEYEPDVYYQTNFQNADGMSIEDGFNFAARSADDEWETVTDAVANYNMGTLTIGDEFTIAQNTKGKKRQGQLETLLKALVDYRLNKFEGIEKIKNQLKWYQDVLGRLQDTLDLIDFDALEKIRLGDAPETTGTVTTTAIIAYPTLSAEDKLWISSTQQQYSDLSTDDLDPHFTLVFPMLEGLELEALTQHINTVLANHGKIDFTIRSAILMPSETAKKNHIFLVPDEGFSSLVKLHGALYTDDLAAKLLLDIAYVPHITLGYMSNAAEAKKVVDTINSQNIEISASIDKLTVLQDSGEGYQVTQELELS